MTKTEDGDLDTNNNIRGNNNNNNNNKNSSSKSSESNPFIRFKQNVDSSIHSALSTLRGAGAGAADHSIRDPDNATSTTPTTTTMTTTTASTTGTDTSLSMLTPSEQHLESRIALLAGGTPAEASLAWRLFLTRSAYSPLRLEHDPELGRPGRKPVPRDVDLSSSSSAPSSSSSRDWDRDSWPWDVFDASRGAARGGGSEFGWLEAFEDLMRVSSGLELSDLGRRRREGQQHHHHVGFLGGGWGGLDHFFQPLPWSWHDRGGMVGFPGGWWGGMREVAWLERMRSRGLTEVLFPVYDPGMGYQSPRTMAEWVERRRAEEKREKAAGRAWEELLGEGRRAIEEADSWVEEAKRDMRKEIDSWRDVADEKGSSFFDGIGGVVKTLGKVLEDEVKSLQRFGKERATKQKDDDDVVENQKTPETENDLYSVIQSAFHESERSLSNFFKSISEARRSGTLAEPKPASPPRVDTTEVVEDGITKKTTKKEFVDEHGNAHSKTETTWTDDKGNVIMRQVHSSVGRTDRWEKTITPASAKHDTETSQEPKEPPKEPPREGGWFWK
ncbi:uncharacterized protein P884DRAFT_266318 [Thermothelomyces heterothallicus CBS 202.75]|uniref:uncharacterized protein n=1 Tax=Thermothelomyces heterothallicus CBS 202.75 TaxID=1149848 RepID=UPI0037435D9F